MPCTVPGHVHIWPESGDLNIFHCEKFCGYCTGMQGQQRYAQTSHLRAHVRSCHLKTYKDVVVLPGVMGRGGKYGYKGRDNSMTPPPSSRRTKKKRYRKTHHMSREDSDSPIASPKPPAEDPTLPSTPQQSFGDTFNDPSWSFNSAPVLTSAFSPADTSATSPPLLTRAVSAPEFVAPQTHQSFPPPDAAHGLPPFFCQYAAIHLEDPFLDYRNVPLETSDHFSTTGPAMMSSYDGHHVTEVMSPTPIGMNSSYVDLPFTHTLEQSYADQGETEGNCELADDEHGTAGGPSFFPHPAVDFIENSFRAQLWDCFNAALMMGLTHEHVEAILENEVEMFKAVESVEVDEGEAVMASMF